VTLTEHDYRFFNYWYVYGRKTGKLMLIVGLVLIIDLMFLYIYKINTSGLINFLIGIVNILFIIYLVIIPVTLFFQTKAIFKSDSFLRFEQKYAFDAVEGLDISTSSSNARIKWDQFYNVSETKKYFYLFIARNKAYIIPKTVFQDENSRINFKKILKSVISKEKLKLKNIGEL
jgi:hypothetical protein